MKKKIFKAICIFLNSIKNGTFLIFASLINTLILLYLFGEYNLSIYNKNYFYLNFLTIFSYSIFVWYILIVIYKKYSETFEVIKGAVVHAVIFLVSIIITVSIVQLCENWSDQSVVNFANKINLFFDSHKIGKFEYAKFGVESIIAMIIFISIKIFLKLNNGLKFCSLAKNIGLCAYYPNTNKFDVSQCNMYIYDFAKKDEVLSIICATGHNTFSGIDTSPLGKIINNHNQIRIILALPNSSSVRNRAGHLKMKIIDYNEHIYNSLRILKKLRDDVDCDVRVRFYSSPPFWRIIFNNKIAILQQYEKKKKIHESPLYAFENQKKTGDYYGRILEIFKKCWNDKYNYDFDFDTKIVSRKNAPPITLTYHD